MDKRTINLLHWLRFRILINAIKHALSFHQVKLGVIGFSFVLLLGLLLFASELSYADPQAELLRSHEPWGLLLFIAIAIAALFVASINLTLRMQEEDILLVLPAKIRTIIQARFIRTLVFTPAVVLIASLLILAALSLHVRIDIVGRLPFAYVSVLLFVLISLGVFWILSGFFAKRPRRTQLAEAVAAVGTLVVTLVILCIVFQGPELTMSVWNQAYHNPASRVFLAGPLAAVDVLFYGGWNLTTGVEILSLLLIAAGALYLAFRYDYQVFERGVSPYQATMGRGTERESPPLPNILDRIRAMVHMRYMGKRSGVMALFECSYSRSLGANLLLSPMIVMVAYFTVEMSNLDSFFGYFFHLWFIAPSLVFFSAAMGFIFQPVVIRSHPDIMRMIPGDGRSKLLHATLPGLIQVGLCYLLSTTFFASLLSENLLVLILEVYILIPVPFVCGSVIASSLHMASSFAEFRGAPEGAPSGLVLPWQAILIVLIISPVWIFPVYIVSSTPSPFDFNPTANVLLVLVSTAVFIATAYALYAGIGRDLDAPRPRH